MNHIQITPLKNLLRGRGQVFAGYLTLECTVYEAFFLVCVCCGQWRHLKDVLFAGLFCLWPRLVDLIKQGQIETQTLGQPQGTSKTKEGQGRVSSGGIIFLIHKGNGFSKMVLKVYNPFTEKFTQHFFHFSCSKHFYNITLGGQELPYKALTIQSKASYPYYPRVERAKVQVSILPTDVILHETMASAKDRF